jgi:Cu/Ag efflux protein CusF
LRIVLVFGLCALLLGASSLPSLQPYEVVVYGTVRGVDSQRRTITIAYAPLDTAPGGIRTMRVSDRRVLRDLQRGDSIQAIADTRRTPWIVRDVHRMQ